MGRKNQHAPHIPLEGSEASELRVVPRLLPETPEQYWDRRHRQREVREIEAMLRMATCAWPFCEKPPRRGGSPLPLCGMHAIEVVGRLEHDIESQPKLTEWKINRRIEAQRVAEREQADRESRSISEGWVYYLRVDERIKIGFTADVKSRMKAYPPNSELLAVHPGTPLLERQMHAEFAGHLAQGREWFHAHEPVMQHIARVVEEFGEPPQRFIYRFREGTQQRIKPGRKSRR